MSRTVVQGILGDSTGKLRAVWYNKWVSKRAQARRDHALFGQD